MYFKRRRSRLEHWPGSMNWTLPSRIHPPSYRERSIVYVQLVYHTNIDPWERSHASQPKYKSLRPKTTAATCLLHLSCFFSPPPSGREKRRKKFNPVRGIEQQSDQLGVIALRDSANKNWKNTYKSFFVPSNNKNISLIILFYFIYPTEPNLRRIWLILKWKMTISVLVNNYWVKKKKNDGARRPINS